MKSFAKLCSMCLMLLSAVAQAQEFRPIPDQLSGVSIIRLVAQAQEFRPIPDMQIPAEPSGHSGVDMGGPVIFVDPMVYTGTLFPHVKYTDVDEMAPCATPKIIVVRNPCADDGCCEPQCVCIEICVPTCGCEEVTCRRFGDRIRYDYGKYAVDVRIKRGHIQVDYQD